MKSQILTTFLPAKGWTTREAIPKELEGCKILFLGSQENSSELVLDYLTPDGLPFRIILGFSDCGMWIESNRQITNTNELIIPLRESTEDYHAEVEK